MERPSLDDDDLAILGLLAEHRVAHSGHVQTLLGRSAAAAGRHLSALERHGLIRRERIFTGQPPAVWITRSGLGRVGSRLPQPRPDLKGYRHDIGAAWLWLAARDGVFGALRAQLSERTMRAHDRRPDRDERPLGVGIGPGEARHYPDLLLETATGHRVAVELELTPKSRRRLDRIMLGYACDARIDAVLYVCPPGPIRPAVEAAARRAGIADLVHVQPLAVGAPHGAPDPAATVARRAPARAPATPARRTPARAPSAPTRPALSR